MSIPRFPKTRAAVLLVVVLFFVLAGATGAEVYDKKWFTSQFTTFDKALNSGDGYSNMTNDKASLTWGENWLLEAYLDMYEATGDKRYIQKFMVHSQRVANNSDKNLQRKDYKGRTRMGWSNTSYSKNHEPIVFLGHTGMILYPLVKFSLMVKNRPELSEHQQMANRYQQMAESAIPDYEAQWRYDAKTGQGNYWLEGDEPMTGVSRSTPLPFNGSLALGRVLVTLYRLTGKDMYRAKATALATYFKTSLSVTKSGAYNWPYRKDLPKPPEDMSHGGTDVDFAVQAYRAGIVFSKADLEKFSKTLLAADKGGRLSMYVDGTDNQKAFADYTFARIVWLELVPVDCRPYKTALDFVAKKLKISKVVSPMVLLGIAKLAKYNDLCGVKEPDKK